MQKLKVNDLEDRLIEFSVLIIKLAGSLKRSQASHHLAGQIIRSGTSSALNYGESRSAESRKDFIHKLQIVLKELRETHVCLKILSKADLCLKEELLKNALKEVNELISIFVKSVSTSKKRGQ